MRFIEVRGLFRYDPFGRIALRGGRPYNLARLLPHETVREILREYSREPLLVFSDGMIASRYRDLPEGVTPLEELTILEAYDRYGGEELLKRMKPE